MIVQICITFNDGTCRSNNNILDFDITEEHLITYQLPDIKNYLALHNIREIQVSGLEIVDELEERMEELQLKSKD